MSNHDPHQVHASHGGAGHGSPGSGASGKGSAIDPVCGMTVDPATALHHAHAGKDFWFCSTRCRDRFASDAAREVAPAASAASAPLAAASRYT